MRQEHPVVRQAMAAIPCEECGKKMNSELVVCPHCGARRAVAPAPAKLSKEDVQALLLTDPSSRPAESRGLFETLVLPHRATRGAARAAEVALTVVSFPLVAAGSLAVALAARRTRRAVETTTGEITPVLAMTVFGGLALISLPLVYVAIPVVAIWTRAVIRIRAARAEYGDLHRIARPEKPARLPPPPEPVHAPEPPAEPLPPGEDPRLLR